MEANSTLSSLNQTKLNIMMLKGKILANIRVKYLALSSLETMDRFNAKSVHYLIQCKLAIVKSVGHP
jgi:hypothetical protein